MRIHVSLIVIVMMLYGCQQITPIERLQDEVPMTKSINTDFENTDSKCYYWCGDVKIPLIVNDDKLYVLAETAKIEKLTRTAMITRSTLIATEVSENYSALGLKSSLSDCGQLERTSLILENAVLDDIEADDIIYAAPYFRTEDGSELGITNILSVQLSEAQQFEELEKIAEYNNLEILGENIHEPNVYYLSCTKDSRGNALEMANLIYESGLVEYAAPEFILDSSPASAPNDPYFTAQWNLNNTSYPIADINYSETMNSFTFPYIDDIVVAVIDNGVYANHEDLPLYNVSYNAHTGTTPSGLYGDHGTWVAGIIGATTNNSKGVTGIASGVKIMPISVCYKKDAERLGITASTSTKFANAIRFAANNGAKVINNSWSFSTSSPMSEINNAIIYAHSKGCVVVFSSGNDSGAVSQPAAGAPSATLVVGSIKQDGYKASDSNYGSSLDLVAPGSDIWTTDWTGGYDNPSGTSFAAPHVSAIAALIWARNPNLQAQRVRNIIEQSVQKVGSNEYISDNERLNGSWNRFYGYGLINAYTAVSAATGQTPSAPMIDIELLTEIGVDELLSMGLDDAYAREIVYLDRTPGRVTAAIENYDSSAAYQWTSTLSPYYGFGSTFTIEYSSVSEPELHEITCKILKNGYTVTTGISIVLIPYNYSY